MYVLCTYTLIFNQIAYCAGLHHVDLSRSMEYVVDTDNLSISAIRTIRVLRPLRAINRIPSEYANLSYLSGVNIKIINFFVYLISPGTVVKLRSRWKKFKHASIL